MQFVYPARKELEAAVIYYNSQRSGLGDEFAEEVEKTTGRILAFPEAWPAISLRSRKCRTNRFPYAIVYQIRDETILIVAVMHLHRKPDYWKNRAEEVG